MDRVEILHVESLVTILGDGFYEGVKQFKRGRRRWEVLYGELLFKDSVPVGTFTLVEDPCRRFDRKANRVCV